MFGLRYIKAQPNVYIMLYKNGRIRQEGLGRSFFYYGPSSSLVAVPISSVDEPFMFSEVTSDFQTVTIQGQVTYRVNEPKKTAELLNFGIGPGGGYTSEDPEKLSSRVLQVTQVKLKSCLAVRDLRQALTSADEMVAEARAAMKEATELVSMGVEVLGLSILAVKPNPETARALEAGVRENLLRQADEAAYSRRNAAVEQERAIKENELNTQVAVEKKKRQVREEKLEADRSAKRKQGEIRQEEMEADIQLETRRKDFVELASENARKNADAEAYGLTAQLKAVENTDPRVLQSLSMSGMDAGKVLALAFRDLADGAGKIGNLNITPDLLREVMATGELSHVR